MFRNTPSRLPALTLCLLAALLASGALAPALAQSTDEEARERYLAARELMNEERYRDAARRFEEVVERYRESDYAAKSLYWKAFALYQDGSRRSLREAVDALERQYDDYERQAREGDSAELAIRIRTRLAELGDSNAAEDLARLERRLEGERGEKNGRDLGEEEKLMALNALLQMRSERALPILNKVLVENRDRYSEEFRAQATFLLSQHADGDEGLDLLMRVIREDPSVEVRAQAVFWLGQSDQDRAFEILQELLADPDEDPEIRDKALFAMSQIGGPEAAKALRDVAMDRSAEHELRAQAIFWLHQNDSREGSAFLIDLYHELDDEELKDKAIFSLAQMGGSEATLFLWSRVRDEDESIEMRKQALFWLGQTDELDLRAAREIYAEIDDAEMREQVIFVLSQSDDPRALDMLIDIARSDDDPELREKAVFWIGQSGDDRAADFLEQMLEGEW